MGIEAAIIGSAILGAGASAYAGNQAAKATKKAAAQANAMQQDQFRQSVALNAPWQQAGVAALNQRNALMGIGGGAASGAGGYGQTPGAPDWNAYLQANPDLQAAYGSMIRQPHFKNMGIDTPEEFAQYHYETFGRGEGRQLPTVAGPTGADGTPLTQSQITDDAYNTFLDSGYARSWRHTTDDDFQQMVGAFGAGGTSMSGSAIGALNDRNRRNTNNAFTQYDNALAGISNTGSALAMNQGQQGIQLGQQIGANNMNAANAKASSYMNTANAFNSALQNTTNVMAYGAGQGWFGGGNGQMPTLANEVQNGRTVGNWTPSDIRVKTNIQAAGVRGGHKWYTYRYTWDNPGTVREGVMAQEVLRYRPDAVASIGDMLVVNYDALGV